MPRGDSTGPWGMGSMTGRGAGYCAGNPVPGYVNNTADRGCGMGFRRNAFFGGRGGGFGYRNRFWTSCGPGRTLFGERAPFDPETERQFLKNRAEAMKAEMDAIKQRLDDLDADSRNK